MSPRAQRLVKAVNALAVVCLCWGDRVLGSPARVARMLFCFAINIAKGAHSLPLKCLPSANCQRESQPQQLLHPFSSHCHPLSQCLPHATALCHLTVSIFICSCLRCCSFSVSAALAVSQPLPGFALALSRRLRPSQLGELLRGAQGRLGHLALNFTRKLSN